MRERTKFRPPKTKLQPQRKLPDVVMKKSLFQCCTVAVCLLSAVTVPVWAQEGPSLQEMPAATAPPPVVPPLRTIVSDAPYYIDAGVTMAPLRPVAEFMGAKVQFSDGILTVSKTTDFGPSHSVICRVGGRSAQIREGADLRTVALPLPVENRLGVVFVPLRFLVESLAGKVQPVLGADAGVLILSDDLKGVLRTTAQEGYRGADAARITFSNRVGRAISIRLSGPQSLAVELGRGQTITRSVRPGVYYYKAASTGMRPRQGARRLSSGQNATWSWGRG
jgi:hypothetical protein